MKQDKKRAGGKHKMAEVPEELQAFREDLLSEIKSHIDTVQREMKEQIEAIREETQADIRALRKELRGAARSGNASSPAKENGVNASSFNTYEQAFACKWIQKNLEEDSETSLPKEVIYDAYRKDCEVKKLEALSSSTFGKVIRDVLPRVLARRLGGRGQSKYFYCGVRRINQKGKRQNVDVHSSDDDDDEPAKKKSAAQSDDDDYDDDEDDEPVKKKGKAQSDEEEEEEPVKKKGGRSSGKGR